MRGLEAGRDAAADLAPAAAPRAQTRSSSSRTPRSSWASIRRRRPAGAAVPTGFRAGSRAVDRSAAGGGRRLVQGADLRRQHRTPEAHRGDPARHLGGDRRLRGAAARPRRRRAPRDRPAVPQRPVHVSHCWRCCSGNHIVVMPRFDAAAALRLIEQHRVDWMYAVPTMMHRIWRLPEAERTRYDVSSLRVVFHMAAPCPHVAQGGVDRVARSRRVLRALRRHRGAGRSRVITGDEWLEHRGSVGRPLHGRDAHPRSRRQRAAAGRGRRDLDAPRPGRAAARTATSAPRRTRPRAAGSRSATSAASTPTATSISATARPT